MTKPSGHSGRTVSPLIVIVYSIGIYLTLALCSREQNQSRPSTPKADSTQPSSLTLEFITKGA
jgi:hypothetical protein